MAVMGVMWIIANKAEWATLPSVLTFDFVTIVGLVVLTRVFFRRLAGSTRVGPFEKVFLLAGFLACFWPLIHFHFFETKSSYPNEVMDKYLTSLLFLLPTPVYLHWLTAGFSRPRSDFGA